MFITSKMDIRQTDSMGIDEFDLIIHLYDERMKELDKNNNNRIVG